MKKEMKTEKKDKYREISGRTKIGGTEGILLVNDGRFSMGTGACARLAAEKNEEVWGYVPEALKVSVLQK
jgi:hypothetical protein